MGLQRTSKRKLTCRFPKELCNERNLSSGSPEHRSGKWARIERHDVGLSIHSCSWNPWFLTVTHSCSWNPWFLTDVTVVFYSGPRSFQATTEAVPWSKPRPLPSTSFSVRHLQLFSLSISWYVAFCSWNAVIYRSVCNVGLGSSSMRYQGNAVHSATVESSCIIRIARKIFYVILQPLFGACGSVVVKAVCYKPEGRGFDSDEVNF
jgi:hypothetical protein